jgi:hypothetical protein
MLEMFDSLKNDILVIDSKVKNLNKTVVSLVDRISFLEKEEKILTLVSALYQKMIDSCLTENKDVLRDLMKEAMRSVFVDQDIDVDVELGMDRKKVSMELVTITKNKDGRVVKGNANESFGGSLATIQSLVLRILVTLKRGLRPVIFIDEGLSALEDDYASKTGSFLKILCNRLNIDILIITHSTALFDEGDKRYIAIPTKKNVIFKPV